MDHSILGAALKSRDAYDAICAADYTFDDTGAIVFETIRDYYEKDPAVSSADITIIEARLLRSHPRHTELFQALLGRMTDADISAPNLAQEIIQAKMDQVKLELSAAFANGTTTKIDDLLGEYTSLKEGHLTQSSDVKIGRTLMELEAENPEGSRIKLLPASMNNRLGGGAMRGQHLILFGRPDAGKTTFALNMAYGFAIKQNLRVLYVSNEDSEKVVLQRFYMRCIEGATMEWVKRNQGEAEERALEMGADEFKVAHPDAGTTADIERWSKRVQADVVIVDQLRNLIAHDESRVQQYEHIARDLRRLAIRQQVLVVSLTQAGDSGSQNLHLGMSDIDGSKTGIQGTADAVIGIGVNEAYLESGHRVLTFDKNKLSLDKDPLRVSMDLRHGRVT